MLTRMYLYSTSTKLSIDVWLYLDRPGSLMFFHISQDEEKGKKQEDAVDVEVQFILKVVA